MLTFIIILLDYNAIVHILQRDGDCTLWSDIRLLIKYILKKIISLCGWEGIFHILLFDKI